MKKITNLSLVVIATMLFTGFAATAQKAAATDNSKTTKATEMKTYLIERDLAGAGKLTAEQLKGIAQKSCGVIKEMGPKIEWVQSYVTGDKLYCVYRAENEELIREHAKKGGFPCNKITEVANIFSPATAN
jgi:hypothetical protein